MDQISHDVVSALRVNMYEYQKEDASSLHSYDKRDVVYSMSMSQPTCEEKWLFFVFKDENVRQKWENNLPAKITKWLDRTLIEKQLDSHWQWIAAKKQIKPSVLFQMQKLNII